MQRKRVLPRPKQLTTDHIRSQINLFVVISAASSQPILIHGFPCGPLPSSFPPKALYAFLITPIFAIWAIHLNFYGLITVIKVTAECKI